MPDQPNLFDDALVDLTVGDGPLVHPARVGFLAGMLDIWTCGGKATAAQEERLRDIARETLARAYGVNPGSEQ